LIENLQIHSATEKDIPAIAMLANKVWHQHYPGIISVEQIIYMLDKMYSYDTIQEQMQNGYVWLIAFSNNTPVGFLSMNETDKGNYYLNKLYVDTSIQRSGAGKFLLDKCIEWCENAKTIRLQVNRKNYTAINFYFKNGFLIEEVKDFDIGSGFFMKDFVMIKKFN